MKKLFIAGNWKSNKTIAEARDWLNAFHVEATGITVVVCVPYTSLSGMASSLFELGAQNVSAFGEGAYTGEVTARQVKELARWVIIGHSERRKNFGETDEILTNKVKRAHEAGLQIIYCVPDENTLVPDGTEVVAYEPTWAIGTGKTDSPENANEVARNIKKKPAVQTVIYGGSVTPDNVKSFVSMDAIDGVLPGGASLDPQKFAQLIHAATT